MPWLYLAGDSDFYTPLAVLDDESAMEKVHADDVERDIMRNSKIGDWILDYKGERMMLKIGDKRLDVQW